MRCDVICVCRGDGCGIYDVLYANVITANSAKPVLHAIFRNASWPSQGRPVRQPSGQQQVSGLD